MHVTYTVKLECQDKEGVPVVLNLYNTLFIPKVNLFSLQKMRMADYLVEQKQKIGSKTRVASMWGVWK